MANRTETAGPDVWTTIVEAQDGDVRLVLQARKKVSLEAANRDRLEKALFDAMNEDVLEALQQLQLVKGLDIVLVD